jgi:ABC-type nitrate/sulfonate/bicarbonate transport system substrate-binding protein
VLVAYAEALPEFQFVLFNVNPAWAQANPEIVKDFIRAQILARRQVLDDPAVLRQALVDLLEFEAPVAQTMADAFLSANTWDANGGFTVERIQLTLDLLIDAGTLDEGLTVEQVADLSYLNAVLDEIGRR